LLKKVGGDVWWGGGGGGGVEAVATKSVPVGMYR